MTRTILNNTLYLSLSSIAALGISFVFNIFLARTLGVDQFGEFAFLMSFIGLFSILVHFSLESVIVRDVARAPGRAALYFGNALALNGLLFITALLLVAATAHVLDYPFHIRTLLYILSFGLFFEAAKRCCVSLFEASQNMRYPAALVVLERLLFVGLGLLAVTVYGSVLAIVICYVVVQGITYLVGYSLVRTTLGIKPESIEYNRCKQLAWHASPFFAISMTAALYVDIDKLFLFSVQSANAVGIYAAAYKLVAIPMQFSNAFHRALYPALSRDAAAQDRSLLAGTYQRSIRYLMLGAIPVGVGMTVFAQPMMRMTYGEAYVGGTIALQILVWAYVFEFFNPFLSRVLYTLGRERSVLAAVVAGTTTNIGLNILLIPFYSVTGAAIATLVSASLIFAILSLSVFPIFREITVRVLVIKPAVAGLAMLAVCILLAEMAPGVVALAGGFVYIACLVLMKAISLEELLALPRAIVSPRPSAY